MKRITRIGIIILVVGISLLLVATMRGATTTDVGTMSEDIPSDKWTLYPTFLLAPRELRVGIQANQTVAVYILDSEGIRSWKADGTLNPLWAFEGIQHETLSLQTPRRDGYAFLVHNIHDSMSAVKISSSLYGFESDLLWGAISSIVFGIVLIIVSLLWHTIPKKIKT
jgi:hypothetical protein